MNRTTFDRPRRTYPPGIEKKDTQTQNRQLLLAGVFILGLLAGRSLVGASESDTNTAVLELISGYLSGRHLESVGQTFVASFGSSLLLLLALLFCGFCAIAPPLIYTIIFLKGAGIGLSYGMLFAGFGWQALPYVTVILLPNAVISSLVLMAAAKEALGLSRHLFTRIGPGDQLSAPLNLRLTVMRFLVFAGILAFAALLDGLLAYLFGGVLGLQ